MKEKKNLMRQVKVLYPNDRHHQVTMYRPLRARQHSLLSALVGPYLVWSLPGVVRHSIPGPPALPGGVGGDLGPGLVQGAACRTSCK